MEIFERKGLSQEARFRYAALLSLFTAIIVGILTGYARSLFESTLWVILIGYCVAYVIRKGGRGVQTRFAFLGLGMTLLGLLLSDAVYSYGLMGLFSFESYRLVISFIFYSDVNQIIWIFSRAITLFIVYSYSRVV